MKNAIGYRKTGAALILLLVLLLPCALAEQAAPSGEYLCPECGKSVTLGDFVSSDDSQCVWTASCGHAVRVDHDYMAVEEIPATCTQEGLKGEICRHCAYRPVLKSPGHSYVYEPLDGSDHKKRCTRSNCTESVTERHTPAVDASGSVIWTFDEAAERHYERCDKCAMTLGDQACDFITVSTLPATCTQEGQQTLRCTICGGHKTDILPAGHDWSAWTQNGAASERVCLRAGCGASEICDHSRNINPRCAAAPVCSVCGAALENQPHEWQSVSYRWNGDECTATRQCSRCRTEEMQSVRALGRSVKATCTERGYTKYEPVFEDWAKDESGAGTRIVYTADALEHMWCPWKNGRRNCLRAGCGAVEVCAHTAGQLNVYGASWPAELSAPDAPPAASLLARCQQCGEMLNAGAATVRRAAEGGEAADCTQDAAVRYEALDEAGRVVSQRDYTVRGTALGHDDEQTVVLPTCTARGYTVYTCRRCGRVERDDETPALGHDFADWLPGAEQDTHAAVCRRAGCGATARAQCTLRSLSGDEADARAYCPICGRLPEDTRLELIENVRLEAFAGETALPGQPVLRRGVLQNGRAVISLCFEAAGAIVRPAAQVTLSLPGDEASAPYDWTACEAASAGIALHIAVNEEGRIVLALDYALNEGEASEAADTLIIVLKPRAEETAASRET